MRVVDPSIVQSWVELLEPLLDLRGPSDCLVNHWLDVGLLHEARPVDSEHVEDIESVFAEKRVLVGCNSQVREMDTNKGGDGLHLLS